MSQQRKTFSVFTYGSLMFPSVWNTLVCEVLSSDVATLSGYARYRVHGEEYPIAVPVTGCSIQGRLYQGVSLLALNRLDTFEGEWYRRVSVDVMVTGGKLVEAEAYVLNPAFESIVNPVAWNKSTFESVGLPKFMDKYRGFAEIV